MIELETNEFKLINQYLKGSDQYVIEPCIDNSKYEIITIDPAFFIDTKIKVLKKNDIYYNLFCIIIKGKDLNGVEEYQCNILGNKIFAQLNNPKYQTIPRVIFNEQNFNNMKKQYQKLIIKNYKQQYFENNLYWDWFKIV